MLPRARKDQLLIQQLPDETLVYDLKHDKAHCLNRTASLVWSACDGKTGVRELARAVAEKLDISANEDLVWFALERLDKAHLLQEPLRRVNGAARCSRRELALRLGLVGGLSILLPLVQSIVAPTAVAAASCLHRGDACTKVSQCCAGCTSCTGSPKVCGGGIC